LGVKNSKFQKVSLENYREKFPKTEKPRPKTPPQNTPQLEKKLKDYFSF